jgi:O-antigen/teichoic acid export membrane protein
MLKKFTGNSFLYVAGAALNRGLSLLLLPLYAKYLTPEDYGIVGLCTAIITLLGTVASGSLESAIPRFYFQLTPAAFRSFLRTVWVFLLTVPAAFVVALSLTASPWLERLLPIPWDPYIKYSLVITYLSVASGLPLMLLVAQRRALMYVLFTSGIAVLNAACMMYFVVIGGEGALGCLRAQATAAFVVAIVSHLIVARHTFPLSKPWLEATHLLAALRFSLPYVPHVLCIWALNLSDRWILSRYVSLNDLGLYNLGYTVGMAIMTLGSGMMSAYQPFYFQHASDPAGRNLMRRMSEWYIFLVTLATLAVALIGPEILRIATRAAYHGAARVIVWIAVAYWFFVAIYQLQMIVIEFHRRTTWTLAITLPAAALNIGLNLLLVPRHGITAAALDTVVGFAVMAALAYGLAQRLDRAPYPWPVLVRMVLIATTAFFIGSWAERFGMIPASVIKTALILVAAVGLAAVSSLWRDIVQRGVGAFGEWRTLRPPPGGPGAGVNGDAGVEPVRGAGV